MGILWFMSYTGLLAKLSRFGWYILLVASSKDIEENSKFHQSFLLIWDIQHYFYFVKISTVEWILLTSFWWIGNIYWFYPSGECLYFTCESNFNGSFIMVLKWWISKILKIVKQNYKLQFGIKLPKQLTNSLRQLLLN